MGHGSLARGWRIVNCELIVSLHYQLLMNAMHDFIKKKWHITSTTNYQLPITNYQLPITVRSNKL
ncbi:hypothetical protein [Scytonema millei]|uniref:Uncharacterized protein n=1 Tax=Scytonema millei VB511283 TaxID=1245923 RepID=A0A9X5E6D9_9CYAN|nr:hypothetical protein [Scytonema millei]NHC36116.1 hypothetical protein [Scytonema millei VB511283]